LGKWGKAKMHQDDLLSITREKFNQAVKEAKPLFCYFSVTEACNLNCKYCGSDSKKPLDNELTTEEVYDVLDNIAEAGTMAVLLAGGEPTSRKDLLQIARYGAAHRLRMAVNTHGHFIDKEYAWKLRDAGVLEVKVSIDGLEETHDNNRGEGSFKRAIEALKPGVELKEIDRIARDYISDNHYGKNFGHSLGHGVGLSVHELPKVSNKSTYKAEEGMVFSIEPGVYIPGYGGIRIEDLILVTKTGYEVITKSPSASAEVITGL